MATQTVFTAVRGKLLRLTERFGLSGRRGEILDTYDRICRESLSMAPGRQRPEGCRLNRDGTAIQFSLALQRGRAAALQFLGEAGSPSLNDAERAEVGVQTIADVSERLGLEPETKRVLDLMPQLAPRKGTRRSGSGPGVYWIGASFPPAGGPALTIYVNTRFGEDQHPWSCAQTAAEFCGQGDSWKRVKGALSPALTPLGTAFTISAHHPVSARTYFSGYGLRWRDYRDLFENISATAQAGDLIDRYTLATIGEERQYPLRSAVCSFQFEPGGAMNPKFELCAHCAYLNDAEAARRSQAWIESEGMDSGLYLDMVELLGAAPKASAPKLHAYVGVGVRGEEPYSTVYLNPGPGISE
ncbi:MAG TPA: hypothetical protein VKV74_16075 [Bryobacteraceae bacterium]|nr:hypothetical protein [Bryobacteraceae bacterium]